jgi:hypothetical protein
VFSLLAEAMANALLYQAIETEEKHTASNADMVARASIPANLNPAELISQTSV